MDSQPPGGTLETLHANTDEMEALHLTNQLLLRELEQLTRQLQHPQEARQARVGHNTVLQEELPHLDPPREADREGETSRARGHDPYLPLREGHNEEIHKGNDRNNESVPHQQGMEERSWEQRFRGIQ